MKPDLFITVVTLCMFGTGLAVAKDEVPLENVKVQAERLTTTNVVNGVEFVGRLVYTGNGWIFFHYYGQPGTPSQSEVSYITFGDLVALTNVCTKFLRWHDQATLTKPDAFKKSLGSVDGRDAMFMWRANTMSSWLGIDTSVVGYPHVVQIVNLSQHAPAIIDRYRERLKKATEEHAAFQ